VLPNNIQLENLGMKIKEGVRRSHCVAGVPPVEACAVQNSELTSEYFIVKVHYKQK
jgi:hypothetical protein